MHERRFVLAAVAAAAIAATSLPALPQEHPIIVFAAASMKNALDDADAAFTAKQGIKVVADYAASSALIKQIEQGAPADLFISADTDWMDYLDKKDLIAKGTRVDLLGNKIVVVAPRDSKVTLDLKQGVDVAKALNGGKLAMANVESVPAGKYGKAALTRLGAWNGVKDKIAQAENVRAALLLVSRGEAPLGIVYATDAAAEPNVKIIAAFPDDSHPPIIYPAAITKESKSAEARSFFDFMKGMKARPSFEKQGFTVLVKVNSST